MTDSKRDTEFKEALEESRALEFIEALEDSTMDVGNFELKQRNTRVSVTCTPREENISDDLRTIAEEYGFERETDAPSLQHFHNEIS